MLIVRQSKTLAGDEESTAQRRVSADFTQPRSSMTLVAAARHGGGYRSEAVKQSAYVVRSGNAADPTIGWSFATLLPFLESSGFLAHQPI
jgi:hypothetical protein